MVTATQFAWERLGRPAWDAPRPQVGDVCWLCGGATGGSGWDRARTIPVTFTNVSLAARPDSAVLCAACAYFAAGESWAAYVAAHPERGLKATPPLSWRSYSHAFSAAGHECPTRARWRLLLLAPPPPPFLFVLTESGQKHLIFRARVGYDADHYPVQVEEDSVWVDRAAFAACLADFEALLALGFSKDQIASGRYHPAQLAKAGLRAWRDLEQRVRAWRARAPDLVRLAAFAAQRPKPDQPEEQEEVHDLRLRL